MAMCNTYGITLQFCEANSSFTIQKLKNKIM